ncbi:MAG: hypothetical protein ACR2LK_14320 [Solirubrobacteraceae bacterium]
MSPAAKLADLLADARRADVPFSTAWPEAIATALADETGDEIAAWVAALDATRSAWQAAWSREPIAGRPLLALVAVAADPDRQQIDPAGECARCGASLEGSDSKAKFCSRACQRASGGERRRAAA